MNSASSVHISQQPAPLPSPSSTPSLTKLNRLQLQNSPACAVVRAPISSHITPALKTLHWLQSTEHIDYMVSFLTYKVLTTTQSSYLSTSLILLLLPLQKQTNADSVTLESTWCFFLPNCWSSVLITLIWSHTYQFIFSVITTVTIHHSSLPLQSQNSSFPHILLTTVLLSFHPLEQLCGLQLFFGYLVHVGFCFLLSFIFYSWFHVPDWAGF